MMDGINIFDFSTDSAEMMYKNTITLPEKPEVPFSLVSYLADILCDPIDKQHVHILCYSASGKGKSLVATAICEKLSIELAKRCGTTPDYHFTVDNIIVADPDKTREKFLEFKRKQILHPIMIIDESGIETNSRRAMSAENVKAVKISVIMRELGMCVIRNVQNIELLDKGIRKQATHELSIETANHSRGYNDCKFKIIIDKPGFKNNWAKYPTSEDGYTKYERIRIGLPSKEMLDKYSSLKGDSTGKVFETELTEETKTTGGRKPFEDVEKWCNKAWDIHMRDPTISKSRCVFLAGGCRETFDKWLHKNNKESWRPVKTDKK